MLLVDDVSGQRLTSAAGADLAPAAEVEALTLFDVVDKEHADDAFAAEWKSFDSVAAGALIGSRADGTPLHAPADARIVFPNPGAGAGQEWYYLARASDRFGS